MAGDKDNSKLLYLQYRKKTLLHKRTLKDVNNILCYTPLFNIFVDSDW